MGACAYAWLPVDTRLLGMERPSVRMERWLLGTAHRFLWRGQLRLRVRRRRLRGRVLAGRQFLLQPDGEPRERDGDSQRLQQDGGQQLYVGQPS